MGNRGVMTPDNLQRNTNKILTIVIFHPHISQHQMKSINSSVYVQADVM